MRFWIVLVLALFVAGASSAAGWTKKCRSGDVTTALNLGEFACNDPDGDSPILNVQICENFDVFFFTDRNADATVSTNTVQIRHCPSNTASATACWPIEAVVMTGASPAEAIYGAAAQFIYADFDAAIVNDPRVLVKCNGPH